jgi:hypothetical protein
MRHLVDLNPRWIHAPGGRVVGVRFDCPTCGDLEGHVKIAVLFENPPDGGSPAPNGTRLPGDNGGRRWDRTGATFESLSLSPSVDCSQCGHWHGFVARGDATGGGA